MTASLSMHGPVVQAIPAGKMSATISRWESGSRAREGKHVESRRLRGGQLQGMCVSVVVSIAALALAVMPAQAKAASPVLEFVAPGTAFPIGFTADGGPVTAELAGFDSVVHCSDSVGDGVITGPRSTISNYSSRAARRRAALIDDQDASPKARMQKKSRPKRSKPTSCTSIRQNTKSACFSIRKAAST